MAWPVTWRISNGGWLQTSDMGELGLGERLRPVVLNGISFVMFGRLGHAGPFFGCPGGDSLA
ncbi:hypothetical protein MPC4_400009 [Methylocella tundrae]|uniref:Uncharacterized protein n=1 Tax=Methylocella tundrae TaxID=227605 RepID=A0A8B6MBZ6_METTU|nr:hypothetical protein MPC1_110011 [Methylocella tundrae]VTZ51608.1 hypothetical protein MPC4_400009 [Methylocella tundrae]